MNIWNRILRRITQENIPLPLGRWKLETCNNRTNQKIDSSNEDHCGTCANDKKPRELPTLTNVHNKLVPYPISSVLPRKSLTIYKPPEKKLNLDSLSK